MRGKDQRDLYKYIFFVAFFLRFIYKLLIKINFFGVIVNGFYFKGFVWYFFILIRLEGIFYFGIVVDK